MTKFVAHLGHVSIASSIRVNIVVSYKYLANTIGLVRVLGKPIDITIATKKHRHRFRGFLYKLSVDSEGQAKVTFDVNASNMTLEQLNALQYKNVAVMVKEV